MQTDSQNNPEMITVSRETLRLLMGRISGWQDDRLCNLPPTEDSLTTAIAMIQQELQRGATQP